jgi:hypothetical protein
MIRPPTSEESEPKAKKKATLADAFKNVERED